MLKPLITPVGELPAGVYWRRRLLVLTIVAALIASVIVLVRLMEQPVTKPVAIEPLGEPVAPTLNVTATTETPGNATNCTAVNLRINVTADKPSYATKETGKFALTINNVGKQPCLLDVSKSAIEFQVRQRNSVLWTSSHCQADTAVTIKELKPNQEHRSTVNWTGTTSSTECTDDKPALPTGRYELHARVGSAKSSPASFSVTQNT